MIEFADRPVDVVDKTPEPPDRSFLGTYDRYYSYLSGFSGPAASIQIPTAFTIYTTNFSEARSSNELNPRVLFYIDNLHRRVPSETTTKQTDKALWRQLLLWLLSALG